MKRGFTLIEILVAIAIFALIAVASTSILSNVIKAAEESEEAITQLEQVQRVLLVLEHDLAQAVPVASRVPGVDNSIVFRGELGFGESIDDGFGFIRAGWDNPQWILPRANLQAVMYRLNSDQQLERLHTLFIDNIEENPFKSRILLENITAFNVQYATITSRQEVDWDDKFEGDVLPLGIAIEISGDNFPTIRREFALLNQTPPSLMPLAPSEQPDNQGRPLGDNNSGNKGGRG